MTVRSSITRKGHRLGGPLRWGWVALFLAGCGTAPGPREPRPEDGGVVRPLQVYRQLGLVAGPERFPAVASFSTMAGPGDSAYVVFGLSLPNSALRFQRDEAGFIARYDVQLTFSRDSQEVRTVNARETVRVPTFAETGRTDESVVYQTAITLPPGVYEVLVRARDGSGGYGFQATDTIEVPVFDGVSRRFSSPLFVYRAEGRTSSERVPELILNPRHMTSYGGEAPRVYLESYGAADDRPVLLRILDEDSTEVWQTRVSFESDREGVRFALIDIPVSLLPLGRLWVETGVEGESVSERAPLLVTISDQWMVNNFDEVIRFLAYIAHKEELDTLRATTGVERIEAWERFWARRDPVPATPANEFREEFFERVRTATIYFGESGRPGWRTDRGEVYIVLGAPDQMLERWSTDRRGATRPNVIDWVYERGPTGRMVLTFVDRTGFGVYELTPNSRSAFRSAAARLRPRD